MNGIEILSTSQVATKFEYNLIVALIISIIIMVISIIAIILNKKYGIPARRQILCVFLCCFIGNGIITATKAPVEYETQYKVIVSDDVRFNEFMDNYEIIDQDDQIYTIRKRK